MLDAKTRESLTQSELVSHHLRRLALHHEPIKGQLVSLCDLISVHPATMTAWIAQGYVPMFQCEKLIKHFGKKQIPLDDLCPEQFRTR